MRINAGVLPAVPLSPEIQVAGSRHHWDQTVVSLQDPIPVRDGFYLARSFVSGLSLRFRWVVGRTANGKPYTAAQTDSV